MRKFLLPIFFIACAASAGVFTEISFSPSDISFKRYDAYDIVSLPECEATTEPGKPMLPVKLIYLTLPAEAQVEEVKVVKSKKEDIEGNYNILPSQPPFPISYEGEIKFVEPLSSLYKSSDMYPGKIVEYTGGGCMAGYKLVGVRVYPLQYIPLEKRLILYKYIKLEVTYKYSRLKTLQINKRTKDTQELFDNMVKKLVKNPQDVDRFKLKVRKVSPLDEPSSVRYVIITDEAFISEFQRLADWKTKKGIPTQIRTVNWIETNYSGYDTQEKIRNFIIDAYQNWGVVWVLLGGDTEIIPHRLARSGFYNGENIPCDLYYSDLDGNWDADGDHIYGEVTDEVDLYPDVFVGRASVEDIKEAQTFVNKVLIYEKNPPSDYSLKMFFMAFDADSVTKAEEGKKQVRDTYVPARFKPITEEYDSEPGSHKADVLAYLNEGYHICNHFDHTNVTSIGVGYVNHKEKLLSSELDGLKNGNKQSIFYTVGCWPGAFDLDCFGEHFINNPNGGAIAFIGNSREGWYLKGQPGYGPSELYDKQFYNSLFLKNHYHLAQTLADSKAYYIEQSREDNVMRWIQFCLNLLGPPELPVWTDTPQTLTVTYPNTFPVGGGQMTILVEGKGLIENALVCLQKDNEVYVYGYTDASGQVTLSISPLTTGTMNITVSAQNFLPYEGIVKIVPASGPFIQPYSYTIDDSLGNGDGIAEPGETIGMKVTLKNYGTESAYNVTGTISTTNPATIIDNFEDYGTIIPGDVATSLEDYDFTIPIDYPLLSLKFELKINATKGNWTTAFSILVPTSISGKVVDLANGKGIEGAIVNYTGPCVGSVTTDINGFYRISLNRGGTYTLFANASGYFTSTSQQFKVPPLVTNCNFALVYPEIDISPTYFDVTLPEGKVVTKKPMTIFNNGTAHLKFQTRIKKAGSETGFMAPLMGDFEERADATDDATDISPTLNVEPLVEPLAQGDPLFIYDVEEGSGDGDCLGVEFDGKYFYVSGGNNGEDPNYVHKFDKNGNYISSFQQTNSSGWGWRDLAWDGEYLYGSDDKNVSQFKTDGTYIGDFPGPGITPCRALAYDPATDHFWTASWFSPIYEFDRKGKVINTFSNSHQIYGMAWDDVSPGGPWLWIFAQEGKDIRATILQFDPRAGVYTGVSYSGYGINKKGSAGGLCFTTQWDTSLGILVGLTQSSHDIIVGYEITPSTKWLSVSPSLGSVAPNSSMELSVSFDATSQPPGTYTADIKVYSNDPDEKTLIIPATMTIVPAPVIKAMVKKTGIPESVYPKGSITYTIAYQNTGSATLTNSFIKDYLPSEVKFITSIPPYSYITGTNTYIWEIGMLAPSKAGTITIIAELDTNAQPCTDFENYVELWEGQELLLDTSICTLHIATKIGSITVYSFDGSFIGTYTTIQQGVDACPEKGSVFVSAGTYDETVHIKKGINMIGIGTPTITASARLVPETVRFSGPFTDNALITGFVIIAPGGGNGIFCNNGSLTITKNIILGNLGNNSGIRFHYSSLNITDNTIIGTNTYGIYSYDSSSIITKNTISGNILWSNSGIYCEYSTSTIRENTISKNEGFGIYCENSLVTIANNTILETVSEDVWGKGCGIRCYQSFSTITNNTILKNSKHGISCNWSRSTIINNTISGNGNRGIYFSGCSSSVIRGNIISGNLCGITFSESSLLTIEKNIVSQNTYRGIDGCYGYTNVEYLNIIKENTISGNGDEGIYCVGKFTEVIKNTISGNESGIYCSPDSSVLIKDNTISGNKLDGIKCGSSSPTITNNTISGNSEHGIECDRSSSPTITNNTISENNQYGIYSHNKSLPIIANNIISGNKYYGIYSYDSSPTITNNTISGNIQHGIYCYEVSSSYITNNIIAKNGTASAWAYGISCYKSTPIINYNCVFLNGRTGKSNYSGCSPGAKDISLDPKFISTSDFHLQPSSPGIEKGINTAPGIQPVDKDGKPRMIDGNGDEIAIVDMGAYEYGSPTLGTITKKGTPWKVIPGSTLTYTIAYQNRGSTTLTRTTIKDYLPLKVKISTSIPPYSYFTAPNTYVWKIGTLTTFQAGTITIIGKIETNTEPFTDLKNYAELWEGEKILLGTSTSILPVGALFGSVTVYSFDGSFIGTYTTIQRGINDCPEGGTVCVRSGTFTEVLSVNKGINLIGIGTPTISAKGFPNTNTVIFTGILTNKASIRGFIITNAAGSEPNGCGIYCKNGSPTITNNTISGNERLGIYCNYSSPAIIGNTISKNGYDGIKCWYSSPTIANNIISGNKQSGIYSYDSSPIIANNIISKNGHYGISCSKLSSNITNNIILDNGFYGIRSYKSSGTIANNTILGNLWYGINCSMSSQTIVNNIVSGSNYGIECSSSLLMITNNTISKNAYFGIRSHTSSVFIYNNIITENGTKSMNCYGIYVEEGTPTINYNDLWENGLGGVNNYYGCSAGANDINKDPRFISTSDFRLKPFSLCIDRGTNTAPGIQPIDKEGNPRIVNGVVDIGAYEHQGPSVKGKITKIAMPKRAYPGAKLTYTITYHNIGSTTLNHTLIKEHLPSGLKFSSCIPPYSYITGTNTYIWEIGTLTPCQLGTITLIADVKPDTPAGTYLKNYVELYGYEELLADSTFTIYVDTPSTPTISVSPLSGWVGSLVIVKGGGYHPMEPIIIDFGIHISITTTTTNEDGSFSATFKVDSQTPGTKTITAKGLFSSLFATCSFVLNSSLPKIVINKKVDKHISFDGTLTYTITYTNIGSATAMDVVIIEVLPENVKLSTVHSPQAIVKYWYGEKWQENLSDKAKKIRWTIPKVLPKESGSVGFTVKVE